ncbi:uncharacterized protein LOC114401264 [Glycine soja]|uniref:uncharacterized protein LOC114401264 n=1 Tax=Glycine soja TaxID=3848 RepID=UPI00103B71CC|nr:uncharacterized protein LOC114401264 [Glycine soja]
MGSSQRKYKQLRTKVCVGLPKKNPRLFKPSFFVPPNLLRTLTEEPQWDNQGTVNNNYSSFGVLFDPNSLTEPSPNPQTFNSGHYLEEDDLKSALGKKRRNGRNVLPQPLITMQRIHISRLVDKYEDDYQSMLMDIKLNSMQHSIGTLQKLCMRYHIYQNKNPLLKAK